MTEDEKAEAEFQLHRAGIEDACRDAVAAFIDKTGPVRVDAVMQGICGSLVLAMAQVGREGMSDVEAYCATVGEVLLASVKIRIDEMERGNAHRDIEVMRALKLGPPTDTKQ